jgi:hypothetical protein
MIKLKDILLETLEEKKADRCKRIADRRYSKPSAYKSGAIVRCRQGKIWKGIKENKYGGLEDTSWTNADDRKLTLKQLLNIIKDYPIVQAPVEKVEKVIIRKDSNGIESDRLSAADVKYPIIIVVDDSGNYRYILDGNHRANKAIDAGLKSISAKLLNIKDLPKEFQGILGEDIDPEEVFSNVGALQTIIDDKRNIGFFSLDEINSPKTFWEIVKENDLGFVKVEKNPDNAYIIYKKGYENQANELKDLANKYNGYLSYKATEEDTRRIGELLGYKKEAIDRFIEKIKTLNEAKKETLRTWFKRKGAPGKTGGWVDCNTCRNGKCKPCGRQKGETRSKYPSCRPTPSQCQRPGQGKTWGKTK